MSTNMKMLLAAFYLLTVISKIQAAEHYLQCWHCSSDTIGAEKFCASDFSEDDIPYDILKERNISVVRSCNSTINSEHERAVCRKTVEEVNGKTITKRFCYYTNKSDPLDHCKQQPNDKNIYRAFCEDCLKDKCNSATQIAGRFGVLLFPIFIAKSVIL